jgi:hypothetical protein
MRGQECQEDLASILLRGLDLALFEGSDSPAIEGLVFCQAGTILFKFGSQALQSGGLLRALSLI